MSFQAKTSVQVKILLEAPSDFSFCGLNSHVINSGVEDKLVMICLFACRVDYSEAAIMLSRKLAQAQEVRNVQFNVKIILSKFEIDNYI